MRIAELRQRDFLFLNELLSPAIAAYLGTLVIQKRFPAACENLRCREEGSGIYGLHWPNGACYTRAHKG
jgi:hypothetical protein